MFRGGTLPQPINNSSAVASIVDQLGLGLKQYQDTKRVQMLRSPMNYLQARNMAYTVIAASADTVYNGALYQIALSVSEGVPATEAAMTARATAIAANTDVALVPLFANWSNEVKSASSLLWVKRLATETAMKRLSAKLDAVEAQFLLEGKAEKFQWKNNDRARVEAEEKISQVVHG
jgi:NACalpha-BTF3-like transcription factor